MSPRFLLLFVIFANFQQIRAQSPIQSSVREITGPAQVNEVKANLVPLIWKASIDDSIISIPFQKIEFFGVQDYVVDGLTRVRELTISTEAQSMIRIYHIRPISAAKRIVNNVENLRDIAEGRADEFKRTKDEEKPVKVFPTTTHAHMVEYRVQNLTDINQLYQSLESAMVDFYARELTPALRPGIIKQVTVRE